MESLNADYAEDVTPAMLGASRWQAQAQALRSAVFRSVLRWWVTEREAIDAIWNAGNWRELTAAYADEQLDIAELLPGEGSSRCGRRGGHSARTPSSRSRAAGNVTVTRWRGGAGVP